MRSATVLMPGTCGELVQGMLDGCHFLVSCPIDRFSQVTVELRGRDGIEAPADCPKARAALTVALRFFRVEGLGARLTIQSELPRGKGMGSSTADVAGAIYAAAAALGREVTPMEVARLCLTIEPTDGSLFPQVVLFDHRAGSLYEELGPAPALDIVVLDLGGQVDTLAYNAVERTALLRHLEPDARQALALVREGVRRQDLDPIGQGATLSARAHQQVLPKPPLEAAIAIGQELGAVGVNVGHSGTVIGVLFPPGAVDLSAAAQRLREEVPGVETAFPCRLINGGCRRPLTPAPWQPGPRTTVGTDTEA